MNFSLKLEFYIIIKNVDILNKSYHVIKKDPQLEPHPFHEKNLPYFEDKANILQMTFNSFFV